jgi:hypothetical protein
MIKLKFLTILFLVSISFIFLKIYQHNLLIKLSYEKQRVESEKNELKKKKSELLVKYFELSNQLVVKNMAQEKLGLQPLKLSQIITFT